jgi:uncharacterized protein YjbJ (UPF0337 family)
MNQDTLKGQWMQLKGKARSRWGKLTDDDMDQIQGQPNSSSAACRNAMAWRATRPQRQVDGWLRDQQGAGNQVTK